MMPALVLPRSDDLHCAPERAALALLDAALSAATATAAVLAENPDVATLGDPELGRDPPLTTQLAARLAARADALHRLVAAYLAAVDDLERDDDALPF
jgi:hypothetical protein